MNWVDPTGHRAIMIYDGGGGGSPESLIKGLLEYERKVGGEFSTYVAAKSLGIEKEVVDRAAKQFLTSEEAKLVRQRGECRVGEDWLISEYDMSPASARSAACKWVMSGTFDISPLDVVEVSVGGAHFALGGFTLSAGLLRFTRTVEKHLSDVVVKGPHKGQLARPFMNSSLIMQEIMDSGQPVTKPSGALRWNVGGAFRGSEGTWELVLDPATNRIFHFNFVSK